MGKRGKRNKKKHVLLSQVRDGCFGGRVGEDADGARVDGEACDGRGDDDAGGVVWRCSFLEEGCESGVDMLASILLPVT